MGIEISSLTKRDKLEKWASQVALVVKNLPAMQETETCGFDPQVGKIP